jgi:glycine cleavage system regulatory protein
MATLILTVIGEDRPGLVSALAAPLKARGASWEDSQMSRLAGKFAGIVLVSVSDAELEALSADLAALRAEGLHVSVERSEAPGQRDSVRLHLELLGADHPGIVADVSAALSSAGINIAQLVTSVRDAPMAGGSLFEARASLTAPPGAAIESLQSKLEGLADELMVEIRLSEE